MLVNYIRTAFRNIWKHKTFSSINILGLAISIICFILIALFIFDELTFDRFHKHADRIYRVVENKSSADGKTTKRSGTGLQVSESAVNGVPGVKDAARISVYGQSYFSPGDNRSNVFYEDFLAVNPGFLRVFSFPLLDGDRNSALAEPHSAIITETSARKYFGTTNAVGKLLWSDWSEEPYKVTAVLKDFPANSSISFHLAVSESTFQRNAQARDFYANDWTSGAFSTYFLLDNNADVKGLNGKLDRLYDEHHKPEAGVEHSFQLQALKDIHFYSGDIEGDSGKKGSIAYIYVFLIVGFFVIFIACVNYINLSTARFMNRGKEIAIRKVAGASRMILIRQFLAEALIFTLIAVVFSLIAIGILLPAFNAFAGKQLSLNIYSDWRIWLGISSLVVLVTLSAGIYPALFQSGLNPLSLLKGKVNIGKGGISLRRSLVVFQFVISTVLIAATLIIYSQMQYVNRMDLGFNKDQLVVIKMNSGDVRGSSAIVKTEFSKLAQVKSVSMASRLPGELSAIPVVKVESGNDGPAVARSMFYFNVDEQFLATYGIDVISGRNFYPAGKADSNAILINETAARELGIEDVKGQVVSIPSVSTGGDSRSGLDKPFTATVVGIVKDFHFQSLHEPLAPLIMGYGNNPIGRMNYFSVKFAEGGIDVLLSNLNGVLKSIDKNHLFEYHFMDKQWEMLYREDKMRQTIFLLLSSLAIFIAALGLLGLTIYSAEQKVKEIGIRKVLGAGVGNIVLMLSRDFLKLVIIASFIAIPVTWYVMNKWLEDFAYRINISWGVFALSAIAAMLVAMATISYQVVKAAVANPVKSLRAD